MFEIYLLALGQPSEFAYPDFNILLKKFRAYTFLIITRFSVIGARGCKIFAVADKIHFCCRAWAATLYVWIIPRQTTKIFRTLCRHLRYQIAILMFRAARRPTRYDSTRYAAVTLTLALDKWGASCFLIATSTRLNTVKIHAFLLYTKHIADK